MGRRNRNKGVQHPGHDNPVAVIKRGTPPKENAPTEVRVLELPAKALTVVPTTTPLGVASYQKAYTYSPTPFNWLENQIDMDLLVWLHESSTVEVAKYLINHLPSYGYDVYTDNENYIVADPGESRTSRIALVSHIDTLATRGVACAFVNGHLQNPLGVLGADDRAGVYALLHTVFFTENRPLLIFPNYEERGGIGVNKLIKDKTLTTFNLLDGIDFFIELDRKGIDEYVYYSNYLPDSLKEFVEGYGYKEKIGSYSDVSDLTDEYLIPHINLSISYFNQHTTVESLSVADMQRNVLDMIEMLSDETLPVERIDPTVKKVYSYTSWDSYGITSYTGSKNYTQSYQGEEYLFGSIAVDFFRDNVVGMYVCTEKGGMTAINPDGTTEVEQADKNGGSDWTCHTLYLPDPDSPEGFAAVGCYGTFEFVQNLEAEIWNQFSETYDDQWMTNPDLLQQIEDFFTIIDNPTPSVLEAIPMMARELQLSEEFKAKG